MTNNQKYLIVIAGPTGVGKSRLAIDLAQAFKAEIISTDSRQLYIEMNIGTAKPTEDELNLVKHHFINHLHIWQSYSASQFEYEAMDILHDLFLNRNVAIACGGTGLYIEALCHGLDDIPDGGHELRMKFDEIYEKEGIKKLQSMLQETDPDYFHKVDIKNPRRLIRALAAIEQTGKPFSSYLQNMPKKRAFNIIWISLDTDRETLYKCINNRVDQMLDKGLEEEVRRLIEYRHLQAFQTVGYQEWIPYFENKIEREEVVRLIKRNSRRYAKRQLTWFKKRGGGKTFSPHDKEAIDLYLSEHFSV